MKNNVYPCKPQFYYIKAGFKGIKTIYTCFRDDPSRDPRINFQKSRNELNDDKGPENIKYTVVKYGETFYDAIFRQQLSFIIQTSV